ncbi:hypothetical protein [Demequina soli]|uniref:hypothetical protein n=1 Tax=Demequina soli TaxID=1638987 RepID=UPI000781DE87|nr:hypothetical protein [Demequina soli]
MNAVAERYGASTLAGVNLIPREIAARRTMRAVQFGAVVAILIAIAGVGLLFAGAAFAKMSASDERDTAAQDESAAVAARDAKAGVFTDVQVREQEEYTLAQIGYSEIAYSQLTASVQAVFDADTGLDGFTIQGPSASGTVAGSGDTSIYPNGVGTIQITARATTQQKATELIAKLEAVPGLAAVRGTSEAFAVDGADTYYGVSVTGVITANLFTGRLMPTDGISQANELMMSSVEPSPEPSASASATTQSQEG